MAFVKTELKPVPMIDVFPIAEHEKSILPANKQWKLVWSDEFDGNALDETKWNFRTHFWGYPSPTFTTEGVEVDGESHLKIHLVRKGDDFYSAHLQTGSLTFDIPKPVDSKRFWPFGAKQPAKFMHKYGYYEIRCRLPKHDGWHAAFWLQSPSIGAHPDPAVAGVECDILETYRINKFGTVICGNGWGGYGPESKWYGHYEFPFEETEDGWHRYAVHWTPEGYTFYADGKLVGEQNAPKCAVSQVEQFILVSTECHGYHRVFGKRGEAGDTNDKRGFWGPPVPELFDAYPDCFEVDYVRVFDEI